MTYSIEQIREGLVNAGYVANDEIVSDYDRGRNLLLKHGG